MPTLRADDYICQILDGVAKTMAQARTVGATATDRLLTSLKAHGVTGLDLPAVGRITRTLWFDDKRGAASRPELVERLEHALELANGSFKDGAHLHLCLSSVGFVGYVGSTSTKLFELFDQDPMLKEYWWRSGGKGLSWRFGDKDPEDGLP